MTFRVTGKESLMGGPPPEDKRYEKWIIEQKALAATARGQDISQRDARREQRVRDHYQAGVAASRKTEADRITGYWAGVRAGDIQHIYEP
jgi:hypothetical protein